MARLRLDREIAEAAVLGGAVLGGGGGGSMAKGLELALLAVGLGTPELADIDDVAADALVVTVSAVGAPAAREALTRPVDYLRAVELLADAGGVRAQAFIANECGGAAVVNGWLPAALLGLPVLDAPCNGRAHPTGVMGSMGLHALPGFVSLQAAVGGNPDAGRYLEVFARGPLEAASHLVRQAAVQAGGLVAVARNPVMADYLREHGAPGAIRQAIALGRRMMAARPQGGEAMVAAAAAALGGEVVLDATVEHVELETSGGFDRGTVRLGGAELAFWNEYMTFELNEERIATFPDLIATLDTDSGLPVSTAEIACGMRVAVLVTPAARLRLGAGMRDPELYRPVEEVTGKQIIPYLRGGIRT